MIDIKELLSNVRQDGYSEDMVEAKRSYTGQYLKKVLAFGHHSKEE